MGSSPCAYAGRRPAITISADADTAGHLVALLRASSARNRACAVLSADPASMAYATDHWGRCSPLLRVPIGTAPVPLAGSLTAVPSTSPTTRLDSGRSSPKGIVNRGGADARCVQADARRRDGGQAPCVCCGEHRNTASRRSASGLPGPTQLTEVGVELVAGLESCDAEDRCYASSCVQTSTDRRLDATADFFQGGSLRLGW